MTESQLFTIAIIGLIVAPFVTVITAFMSQAFTWATSAEARKRDLEDRRELARQAKVATEAAAEAARQATQSLNVVHSAVIEVGLKADASYKEANNANLKIQAVQDVLTTALSLPQKPITTTAIEAEKEGNP